MRKKIAAIILCCLTIPLLALFGCGEKTTYQFSVFSSSTICGSVNGSGSVEKGKTVTLTASAKNGSSFVAWIFQGTTEIQNNNGYTISTTEKDGSITQSTLKFKSSSDKQGKYTAVFSEDKMTYVKLQSFSLTKSEATESSAAANMVLTIMQGADLETVYNETVTLSEQQTFDADVTTVMNLNPNSAQSVRANIILTDATGGNLSNFNFISSLQFQTSTAEQNNDAYTTKVDYLDGTYTITFNFTYVGAEYDLILNYQNLGKTATNS